MKLKYQFPNTFVPGRISVIIPTFNRSYYVKQTLENVLYNKRFFDIEVIVIDDGSKDNTKEVISCFSDSIKYVYQDNFGPSYARNTGISLSTGQYLFFLDSDDLISDNYIAEHLINLCKMPKNTISICKNFSFSLLGPSGDPISRAEWVVPRNNFSLHLHYLNIAPIHSFFFDRYVIEKTGLFDTSLTGCEDYDFWYRAFLSGARFIFTDKTAVFYRQHKFSLTKNFMNMHRHDKIIFEKIFASTTKNTANCPSMYFLALSAHALRLLNNGLNIHGAYDVSLINRALASLEYFSISFKPDNIENLPPEFSLYLSRIVLSYGRCKYHKKYSHHKYPKIIISLGKKIEQVISDILGINQKTLLTSAIKAIFLSRGYSRDIFYEIMLNGLKIIYNLIIKKCIFAFKNRKYLMQ